MRYAVTTGAAGADLGPAALAALAVEAEAAGWDGFFLEDYLVYQGRHEIETFDPWVCLAAMAVATTQIRLGLTVVPLSRRRPWTVAAQAVSIDHLSCGRLILGVGSGNPADPDFTATGDAATPRVLAERLDESLMIISALWSGEPVTFTGRHFRVDGLRLAARPVQRPRIPLWVGGNLALGKVRRRVAAWDGSCAFHRTAEGNEILPATSASYAIKSASRAMGAGPSTSRSAAALTGVDQRAGGGGRDLVESLARPCRSGSGPAPGRRGPAVTPVALINDRRVSSSAGGWVHRAERRRAAEERQADSTDEHRPASRNH